MIEDHIVSCIEGRVRLRHPALQEPENAQLLRPFLEGLPGMNNVVINPRTGSLLLEYNPERLNMKDLLESAAGLEAVLSVPETKSGAGGNLVAAAVAGVSGRRLLSRSMLVLLAASVALGLGGYTRGHVVTGGLFVLLNMLHVYRWRRSL